MHCTPPPSVRSCAQPRRRYESFIQTDGNVEKVLTLARAELPTLNLELLHFIALLVRCWRRGCRAPG